VTTSGDCYNCCYQRVSMGNLVGQTVEEVWNGEIAQATRKAFLQGEIPVVCEAGVGNCPELGRE
jgi:hypothetical protein